MLLLLLALEEAVEEIVAAVMQPSCTTRCMGIKMPQTKVEGDVRSGEQALTSAVSCVCAALFIMGFMTDCDAWHYQTMFFDNSTEWQVLGHNVTRCSCSPSSPFMGGTRAGVHL